MTTYNLRFKKKSEDCSQHMYERKNTEWQKKKKRKVYIYRKTCIFTSLFIRNKMIQISEWNNFTRLVSTLILLTKSVMSKRITKMLKRIIFEFDIGRCNTRLSFKKSYSDICPFFSPVLFCLSRNRSINIEYDKMI